MFKFQISSDELAERVQRVVKIVSSKPSLSILEMACFRAVENEHIEIICATSAAELKVKADVTVIEGSWMNFCINAKSFNEVMQNVPLCMLTIVINDDHHAVVEYFNGKFEMMWVDADEYPVYPSIEDDASKFTLLSEEILPMFEAGMSNTGCDELRPIMQGICMDIDASGVTVVATDSHRLYKDRIEKGMGSKDGFDYASNTSSRIVVPKEMIGVIMNNFKKSEQILFRFNDTHIGFYSDTTILTCRKVDGNFPNYNSVIPKGSKYMITVDAKMFSKAIKRVSIFSSSASNMITIESMGDEGVKLSANDVEFSTSSSEVFECAQNNVPKGMVIGLKGSMMLGQLSLVKSDHADISMESPERCLLVTDPDINSRKLMLIMPMKVN